MPAACPAATTGRTASRRCSPGPASAAGRSIGASDKNGAYPATRPYSPGDLGATVYNALGVDPEAELRDRLDRPIRLYNGEPIGPLYTG